MMEPIFEMEVRVTLICWLQFKEITIFATGISAL